jgi:hypothetical protein
MCDCRSDWVMCFRRDCERAAALNEATSSRSNEHLNLLMTPVGASKGQARNWHTMPTSTTYDSRVGRLFNGFIAHRARSYTQSVCLSAGVRVPSSETRIVPSRYATGPAARQRPLPDAEIDGAEGLMR